MINLTLRQLRYFEALARHGHFGRAAEACAISQPALSLQIRDLEEAIGLPLFERASRHVRLTAFGEAFAPRARAILQGVEDLEDFSRSARRELAGRLRLGVIPTIAPYLLPIFIRELTHRFPGIDLHLRETLTPRLLDEVMEGRIDAAIVALPLSEPALTEVALFEENFMLVRPQAQADLPVPDAASLREMRLLLLEEGHCFRDQALAFCDLRSVRPREVLDGTSLSTLVQMVGAGIGVTLIPEMAVAVEARSAPVAITAFADPQPCRTIGMVWRKTNPLTPQLIRIAEVVRDSARLMREQQQNAAR
ncbi:MAG: LysR family transcriptional regulator [Proteobacteria bacterium]|nr:LysR family transcriptional regulator [Pseudomonadota bacterium]